MNLKNWWPQKSQRKGSDMKVDDLPQRYQEQVRPQLAAQVNLPQCGQVELGGGMIVAPDAVEEESALHEDVRKLCQLRGWLPLHGSMAHKAWRTKGEWDFVILAEHPTLLLIELKDKDGKVTKEQAALAAWAKKLGWNPTVCRSMREVNAYASSFSTATENATEL